MSETKHLLTSYSQGDKVAYLSIVASIASADHNVSDEEIAHLRKLCKSVEISSKGLGTVISAAEHPSKVNVVKYIKDLSSSDLRFSLMTDIIALAFADDEFTSEEETKITAMAKTLKIKPDQLAAIKKYIEAVRSAQTSTGTADSLKKLGGDVTAGLAASGVPIAAVAIAGYSGLSAAGIASGLAVLGLGFGMATGIGAVAAIGVGSYLGVRALYKKMTGA